MLLTYFYAYYTWSGKSMYMDDLYVRADSRGQGVGSKLINRVIEQAKADKCKRLRWQVSEWNKYQGHIRICLDRRCN